MMHRIREHLSYSNVISTLALFLVLGGGTALAAYVVSSNSQIGPGTVSGHKPPSGAHANVIVGSVNGQDVADNSLGAADVLESSLTGDARKLIYNAAPSQQTTTVTTAAPYTIKGRCFTDGIQLKVRLVARGPAGTAQLMYDGTSNDNPNLSSTTRSAGLPIPANTDTAIVGTEAEAPDHNRVAGTAMLRSGSALVQVEFNGVADLRSSPGSCFIYGTAVRGT